MDKKTKAIGLVAAVLLMTGCAGLKKTVNKAAKDHPEIVAAVKEKAKETVAKEVKKVIDRYLKPTTKEYQLEGSISFEFDSHELSDAGKATVDKWAGWLKAHGDDSEILLIGRTDSQGDPGYNEMLGKLRSDAAARHLWDAHKINFTRITSVSIGEQNQVEGGHAANRYVEAVAAEFVYTELPK